MLSTKRKVTKSQVKVVCKLELVKFAKAIESELIGRAHAEPVIDQFESDVLAEPEIEAIGPDSRRKATPQVF